MPTRPTAVRRRAVLAVALSGTAALGVALVLAPALASAPPQMPAASASGWYPATVTRVVDGDTFETSAGQTIRVLGLDSPETRECYGSQATDYARRVLLDARVLLARDTIQPDTDRYGRDLRHVGVAGANYAVEAIRQGYGESNADTYVNDLATRYDQAERTAQAAGRGLWSACGPARPAPAPAGPATGTGCDPNYTGYCVPQVSGDLDCSDIGHPVTVVGSDPHRFDGDRDGTGCQTNP